MANSLINLLKTVEALSLQLGSALEKKDQKESPGLLRLLLKQNKVLYRQAKKEKMTAIARQASLIGAQIYAVRHSSNYQSHLGLVLKICQEAIAALEEQSRDPGESWFINGLAVAVAAANLKMIDSSSRVAALLFTKHRAYHLKIFAGNDESEVLLPKHAEINAIVNARLEGKDTNGAAIFISDVPCFFNWTVELSGSSETMVGKVIESNDLKSKGKILEWKKIRSDGDEMIYDYYPFGEHFKLSVKEVFNDSQSSVVYYYYKPFWIPREVRRYSMVRDHRFVNIRLGCAITLSFLRFQDVYYIHSQEKFNEGLHFLKSHNVNVHLIDHPLFQRLGGMAKKTKGARGQLIEEINRLSFKFHVDFRELIKDRFGIELFV